MKHCSFRLHELCALAVIAAATLLRLYLISQNYPGLNSDEGTMGLMAFHIAYRGEYPMFFYGQGFMGSLEAYLAAGMFHLFGPSVFALRLGLLIIFALFLVSMYLLTSQLYTKNLALVTVALLSIGSHEMLFHQLEAAGGYPETLFFGSLLLLLAVLIARSSSQLPLVHKKWKRLIAYGIWGGTAGLALWSDPLVVPFVIAAGLLLLRFCWSELGRPVLLWTSLGFTLGLLPVIIYNITAPVERSSFTVLGVIFAFHSTGIHIPGRGIGGMILTSIPLATGASPLCHLAEREAWSLSGQLSSHPLQCTIAQGVWGSGFIILGISAAFFTRQAYRKLRAVSHMHTMPLEQRNETIRLFARLALLGSAGLTLAIFALSPTAGENPSTNSRYLIGLLIALPAIISPLWGGITILKPLPLLKLAFKGSLLLLIGITLLSGTRGIWKRIPPSQADMQQENKLIHKLEAIGATHIYADYWICNRIIFQSNEHIICSVIDEQLQPGLDRYLPYRTIVKSDARASYVFHIASTQAAIFEQKIGLSGQQYHRFEFEGYIVYQPQALSGNCSDLG